MDARPSLQRLCKSSLSGSRSVEPRGPHLNTGKSKIWSLFPAGSGQKNCKKSPVAQSAYISTDVEKNSHTRTGRRPAGMKMSIHYATGLPRALSPCVCVCVCWQSFHVNSGKENNTIFIGFCTRGEFGLARTILFLVKLALNVKQEAAAQPHWHICVSETSALL